ncbi:hypothetical protein A3860_30990 [Niastella vici]|uniref:Lipocalin-like domain-containing protein n=1 Tax=Niastella vici TaxID=1703345 RepID=A0A1V9FU74_9BACT|nr:hypothetical protein [Niastella vici]OQP61892.1 hypothetical protein A3860_30990 [Niastella vici]
MKPKTTLTLLVIGIGMIVLPAYTSSHIKTTPSTDIRGLAIKYYSGKLKLLGNGLETGSNTTITINPATKIINVSGETVTQEKVNFNITIESIECNLNEKCTAGEAIYHGYIAQKKGAPAKLTLKVEARSGSLVISNSIPGSNNEYLAYVSKWEIIKD